MSTFIEVVKRFIKPYTTIIIGVIVLIIFIVVGTYSYNTFYTKPTQKKESGYSDVANANMDKIEVIIYFFHVDWCPHCKTALPELEKFKNEFSWSTLFFPWR
jgi:thiol-disulfide isomerase/thioredoxin